MKRMGGASQKKTMRSPAMAEQKRIPGKGKGKGGRGSDSTGVPVMMLMNSHAVRQVACNITFWRYGGTGTQRTVVYSY
jgi:hypothetical protein